jgi:hypothetical protein
MVYNKKGVTMLEKIADNFVNTVLKNHPIMAYELHSALEDYAANVEEFRRNGRREEILLEYLKNKTNDDEINDELINALEKGINAGNNIINTIKNNSDNLIIPKPDEEMLDSTFMAYTHSITDPVIYELMHLVIRNSKVRIRDMHELVETEQDDPIIPDKWIYHKNWNLDKVLNYIRNENDVLRKEDDREEGEYDSLL